MRYLLPAIAALLMLSGNSCSDNKQKTSAVMSAQLEQVQLAADTVALPVSPSQSPAGQAPVNTGWDKKIVKSGVLEIEAADYNKYNETIHQLLKKWEAYIASEQENSSDYKRENIITIKIPVQYFDDAVQYLSTTGKLLTKQINAQDVTGEYFDTKARMEAKKRVRLRYLDMLQKAKNMEEILQVEREINGIQEQIEAGEGRVNYLGHAAAYSTIQLTFFQILNAAAVDNYKPGFGKRMLLAMNDGLKWVSELVIFLITLWPLFLGLFLSIWIIKKAINSRKSAPAAKS